MGDTEKISVLILSLKKVHCKIIGHTDIKDFDQTAHLRISDVNISIKDPGGGGWLRGGWWRWGTSKDSLKRSSGSNSISKSCTSRSTYSGSILLTIN